MTPDSSPTDKPYNLLNTYSLGSKAMRLLGGLVLLGVLAVEPAFAQSVGEAFCQTKLVQTARNILNVIQFGGPLLGAILAAGATALIPVIRSSDYKQELKSIRNQGVIYAVILTPLSITIFQFIMNSIVAGGTSCMF